MLESIIDVTEYEYREGDAIQPLVGRVCVSTNDR